MAVLIICMLLVGMSMVKSLAVWHLTALSLHKWFGLVVFLLVILRLVNTSLQQHPSLPNTVPKLQATVAQITHFALYVAMVLMPISGYLMQNAGGRVVTFFGLFDLPSVVSANIQLYGLFREVHGLVAWMFAILVVMHISAALFHGFVKRDGMLRSMWKKNSD